MTGGSSLADRVRASDARAIARAISIVEDEAPEANALMAELHAAGGRAYLIGVTGPPGAGKSTLVDRMTRELRASGHRVGVIAVDPSSPFTGGAVLGDRVRMQAHAQRRRRVHPQHGDTWTSGWGCAGDQRRRGRARRRRVRSGDHRDRRRGTGRDRYRAHGGYLDRRCRARSRRRGPGHQSRHHGNRGRVRGQQE